MKSGLTGVTAFRRLPNMVAWFPFDETTGSTAANHVTGGASGTLIGGPTHVLGEVAGALRFDGVNDYVQVPSSPMTNIGTGDLSIDAWIRLPSLPPGLVEVITDKRDPTTGVGYSFWLYNNRLGLQLADSGGNTNYTSAPIPTLADNQWHHVAVTVRRASNVGIQWFHNGAAFAPPGNPTARLGSLVNNSPLRIGTRTASSPLTGWYKGDIDELEIFNRVLGNGEVLSLFNAGSFGKCK